MRIIWMALVLVGSSAANAQETQGVANDLIARLEGCRRVDGSEPRLACFEAASAALIAARDRKEVVLVDREGVRKVKRSVFGFSLPKIHIFGGGSDNDAAEPEVKEIESTLSAVRQAGYGLWSLQLADGSVWQTTEQRTGFAPAAGQPIKVEASILGSYKATIRGRSAGKVKRIR